MEKKRRIKILAVVLICAVDILWAAGLIYFWKEKGIILSVRNASANLPGIFLQNLAVNLPTLILLGMMLFKLRKKFVREMYLNISGDWENKVAAVLLAVLAGVTVFCLITKEDNLCKRGRDYTSLCGDLRDDRNVGACMYRMCVSDLERKIRNNLAYGSAPRSHGLPCGVELRGRMRYHCQNHA